MIDYINLATEKIAYYTDVLAQREAERAAYVKMIRVEWAQRNGNDSGFDPYVACED